MATAEFEIYCCDGPGAYHALAFNMRKTIVHQPFSCGIIFSSDTCRAIDEHPMRVTGEETENDISFTDGANDPRWRDYLG